MWETGFVGPAKFMFNKQHPGILPDTDLKKKERDHNQNPCFHLVVIGSLSLGRLQQQKDEVEFISIKAPRLMSMRSKEFTCIYSKFLQHKFRIQAEFESTQMWKHLSMEYQKDNRRTTPRNQPM